MDGGRVKQVDGSLGTQPKALSAQINQERARIGLPAWENSTTPIRIKRPPTASGYDSEIRGFNRGMQINRACREICGQDLDCRRLFLIQALMHGFIQRGFSTGSDPNSPRYKLAIELLDANLSKLLLQMKQRWPSHGFEQVASVIADRDPFTHAKEGGQTERFEVTDARAFLKHWNDDRQKRGLALLPAEYGTLSAAEITRMLQYDSTNPFIHAFEDPAIGLKGVPGVELRHTEGFIGNSKANPKKERPMADKIGDPAKLESFSWQKLGDFCFGHMPRDWDYLDGLSPQAVQDQILGSSPGAKALLEPWPPSRESIQTTLRVLLKSQSNCADCSSGANSSVSPLLPGQIKSIEQVSSSLRPNASMTDKFNFYCARCHKTGPARELPLDNLSGLAKYGEGLVIDRLEGVIDDIMPPTRPRDIPRPSDETRKEMIEALRVIVRKNGNAAGK
jgi:hypothetical protein